MQPGVLFLSNAGSPYRGLPQDDTSFITKFLGFASPPHDGFADKYSIVTKENLQAVYAAPPLCTFIIHTAKLLVKCFSKIFCWLECKSKFRIFGKIGELAKKWYFCGRYFCKVPPRTYSNPKIGVKHLEVNLFCKTNVNPCFCLYSLFCPVLPVFFIF